MRVLLRKLFIAITVTMTATLAATAPVVDPGTLLTTFQVPPWPSAPQPTNIVAVSARDRVLLLTVDGHVVTPWGFTSLHGTSNVALIAAGHTHDVALMQDGSLRQWPATNQPPIPSNLTNVVALAAGNRFTCALQADGKVVVWGRITGATNVPPGLTNIVAIAAGRDHLLALTDTGKVVAWGGNSWGQTNVPAAATNIALLDAAGASSVAATSDGIVWRWGQGYTVPAHTNVGRHISQLALTISNTYALDIQGNLLQIGPPSIRWNVTNLAGIFTSDSNLFAIARGPVLRPPPFSYQYPPEVQSGGYGENWALAVTAESYHPFMYQWFMNGAPLPGANNRILRFTGLRSTDSGTYFALVTNSFGTMTSAPVTLNTTTACDEAASRATETANNTTPASFGSPPVLPPGFVYSTIPSGVGSGSAVTSMAFAPDGRIFVCEQRGSIRIAPLGPIFPSPFATVTRTDYGGEIGLLGIAFDPGFHTNSFLYVYYTAPEPDLHNRISRLTATGNAAKPCSEKILLEIESPRKSVTHQGGALQFGRDGKLYAGVGDHTLPPDAQSVSSFAGKILRINPDGSIPEDNPFYDVAVGPYRAIWAMGLRNPFTFAIHQKTGRMLINDVGGKWEELNEGFAGANYGWPIEHGDFETNIYTSPVHTYLTWPSSGGPLGDAAIIGAAFYDPPRRLLPPEYVGSYFFGDYCRGWIHRLDTNGIVHNFASNVVGLVDIDVGPDGALYCLLNSGVIFRFAAAPGRFVSAEQLTDGRVHLRVTGVPNQPYILEQSTDLENWQPLSTNQSATNPFDLYDSAPPNTRQRFYRLRD